MKKELMVLCWGVVALIFLAGGAFAADSVMVRLYNVTQDVFVDNGATIYTHIDDTPILYRLEMSIENDDPVTAMSLGLAFSGDPDLRINWEAQPNGWGQGGLGEGFMAVTVELDTRFDPDSGGTGSFDFDGFLVGEYDSDGIPGDSILIGGARQNNFLPAGPMDHMFNYYFTLAVVGESACVFEIDSAKVGPAGEFLFVNMVGRTYCPGFCEPLNFTVNGSDGMILDADDSDARPDIFSLGQNYPNPFNPTTRVDYSLARGSDVTIVVYNVLGQMVNTLVDEQMAAGEHSVIWNGDDSRGSEVASGIYFYRMVSDEFVETHKMVLMR